MTQLSHLAGTVMKLPNTIVIWKEMKVAVRHFGCGDLGMSLPRRPHHGTSSDNTIVIYVGFGRNHMTRIATRIEAASRGGSNEPRPR